MKRTRPTTRRTVTSKGLPSQAGAATPAKPRKPAKDYSASGEQEPPADLAGMSVIEHTRWLLTETLCAYRRAERDHSHVACRQLLRDVQTLRAELEALESTERANAERADTMSDAQWSGLLAEKASALADDDLEVFVSEYLQRNRNVRLVPL